jgi:hypothetical protein
MTPLSIFIHRYNDIYYEGSYVRLGNTLLFLAVLSPHQDLVVKSLHHTMLNSQIIGSIVASL